MIFRLTLTTKGIHVIETNSHRYRSVARDWCGASRSALECGLQRRCYITQLAVAQMQKQQSGAVVSITAALADQPIAGVNAAVPMITKGGLNAVIKSLAIEYAKEGIRFNAVAPGIVDTPMHTDDPKESLRTLQPMGQIARVDDVIDAVLYLAHAGQVSGEVLHVDGGSHAGRW